MSIDLSLGGNRSVSLQTQIEGTVASRVMMEFLRNSAIFPTLDAIREIATNGWWVYFGSFSNHVLFWSVLIQAYFLGTAKSRHWYIKFSGHLLGFTLYAIIEIALEGATHFFEQPYHWLFGLVSLLMAVVMAAQTLFDYPLWQALTSILLNMVKISLLSGIYMLVELNIELSPQLTWAAWLAYMQPIGHQFILYGTLFFGLILGLIDWQRLNYADSLRMIAIQLKQYSEWSLSADLVADAVNDPTALQLRRIERTLLFMDIRGFTAWTEKVDPQQAVDMLNHYYQQAELIITQYGGHKPNFTADEVMTRFYSPDAAMAAAIQLQEILKPHLAAYHLAVGIGLHTGEVIEGLMGSTHTRKYDIIGDTVNTAKRLESAAGQGEIVLSLTTYHTLTTPPPHVEARQLQVKGKSEPLQVFAISQ